MNSGLKTIEIITEFSKTSSADHDCNSLNKLIYNLCIENGLRDDTAIPKISEADYKALEKMLAKLGNKNIALSFESFKVEHIELNQKPFSFAAYIEHLKERY
ncbi:MAG: hypothetical protein VKK32_09915 [Candidatus Melainabacteria bacterium]|nr:hypothetical protein [Candidatus Melainabacteria bacterium]